MKYQVKLTGTEQQNSQVFAIYGSKYFPRTFNYKRDAENCKKTLQESYGGKCEIEKVKG